MALRICLVTPFDWSQPHDVNEHVAGVAAGLRELDHAVTILAPSTSAREIAAGRRSLLNGADATLIALGPALPISRGSGIGVPVGARANLELALGAGRFDVVHGFEPGLPSLSYLALRDTDALAVATFLSGERLARSALAALHELPEWELVLLRTKPLTGRPYIPLAVRDRVHVRTARSGPARAPLLNTASVFVPAVTGLRRVTLEARAAGAAVAEPPGVREQPELAAAEMARLADDEAFRARRAG